MAADPPGGAMDPQPWHGWDKGEDDAALPQSLLRLTDALGWRKDGEPPKVGKR